MGPLTARLMSCCDAVCVCVCVLLLQYFVLSSVCVCVCDRLLVLVAVCEGSVHVRELFKVLLLEVVLGHSQHQAHVRLGLLALREASAQHQHLVLRQSAAQAGEQAPVAHTDSEIY